ISTNSTEIAPDVFVYEETALDAYDIVHLSLKHTLAKDWYGLGNATLQLYAKNLLNEKYENSSGYLATGLTVGTGIELKF
ncbi:MAG: hypothetical protein ACLFPD_01290, partial [Desulfosudaceae bacterium]